MSNGDKLSKYRYQMRQKALELIKSNPDLLSNPSLDNIKKAIKQNEASKNDQMTKLLQSLNLKG